MEPYIKEENETVFIIDDEVDTCFLISIILNEKNISSAFASTLAEARTALLTRNPTLIFLDNQLPDGWGVDFIDFIRDLKPQSKIILYSAFATPEMRHHALTKGADFMNKPFTKSALESAVASFIKH